MGKIKGMEYSDTRIMSMTRKSTLLMIGMIGLPQKRCMIERKKLNIGMRITPMK